MASEVFTRELKDFGGSLWSMKNEKKFCDATIITEGQRIEVHTVILASSSEFFQNAFENSNQTVKEVSFNDVDVETLLTLVEYCYTGSITITESNVNKVFKMAKFLSIKPIVDISLKIQKKLMSIENCLSTFKKFRSANSEALMPNVLDFIIKNFEKVSQLQDFLDLEYSDVKELLSQVVDVPVITVYNALKKWGKHDISRLNNFVDLLDHIKLDLLPRDVLLSETQEVCNLNSVCLQKFILALTVENSRTMNYNSERKSSDDYNTLIAVGNYDDKIAKIIEIFDLDKNEWIAIQYDELTKESFSAVLIQDKIMAIGGYNNMPLNNVEYCDLNTGEVKYLPPMKHGRYFTSAVKILNQVYVFGGLGTIIRTQATLPFVDRWDQFSKTWTSVAPMAKARRRFGVGVIGSEIFVVGGIGDPDTMAEVEAYNPIDDKWRTVTPMNEKRTGHGVAVVNGFLYAVGGKNESGSLKTVEKYDPNIQKWTMVQSIDVPKYGLAAANLNDQLVIIGGMVDDKRVSTVERYDETTNIWRPMPSLKNSRYYPNLIQIPWKLAKNVLSVRAPK